MATTQNTTKVLKYVLAALQNELVALKLVTREFDADFKGKIGQTAYIKKPQNFLAVAGPTMSSLQSINEDRIPITIDTWFHVPVEVSMAALILACDDPKTTLFKEIARPLAVKADASILALAKDVPAFTGTFRASIASFLTVLTAGQILTENGVPEDGRVFLINPDAKTNILNALKTLLLPSKVMDEILTKGNLGYELDSNQLIISNNVNKSTGSPALSGASVVVNSSMNGTQGDTMIISGLAVSQTLKAGENFSIANLNAINIDNKVATGRVQQFTTITDTTSSSGGQATIKVWPSIVASGAYQNCDTALVSGAAVSFATSSASYTRADNMIFKKEAFAFASVAIPPLDNMISETLSYEGIGITMSATSDIINYRNLCRFDTMYGVKAINPNFAIRIIGN